MHRRAVKYYYGLWDKLCQRSESKAHRDIVERVWRVAEKIWVDTNSRLPLVHREHKD